MEHQRNLLIYIRSKVNHSHDAEDILSHVFLKLLQQKQKLDNPVGWLYLVAKNLITDYYRRKRPQNNLYDVIEDNNNVPDHFQKFSLCITPLIQALDDNYKEVLLQADINRLKQKDVAILLNLSLAAVKSRVLRGRQKLQSLMIKCCVPQLNERGKVTDFALSKSKCRKC